MKKNVIQFGVDDFLFGLDDVHSAVRSQICAQVPFPDLDTVYQTIVQNETIFRDLPKDLVEDEILCHVPATYLKRLGSTCKRWNRLFNGDGRFARKHTDKAAAKQLLVLMKTRAYRICLIVFDLEGPVPSVEVKSELSLVDSDSAPFDIYRVFHCDGLLLCTSQNSFRFVVWNPFTGETRWFRPSSRGQKGYRTFVLGYSQEDNKKSYKVLSSIRGRKYFEIHEFSSDSWRMLDDVIPPGWTGDFTYLTVSLKGSTYWFASDGTKAQRNASLLKFDYSTEKSVPVPLPYQCVWLEIAGLSVVKEEKLSRVITCNTEIWVTNKIDETTHVVSSWSKVLALDLSHADLQIVYYTNFLLDEDKKVVMICENWLDMEDETETKNKDVIYIVGEDNKVTQVAFGLEITYVRQLFLIMFQVWFKSSQPEAKGKELTCNLLLLPASWARCG
ncbi:hypothetical protein EUTSA_v10022266mg [Eutrema salsugineum]|uniref:F-box associated domain-containing protein n=1 Tax=Eutrema salsugineum TaxID=72664 RepID=V4NMN3_EUTSA|nr:hypothetical protein EUTSA_v10022266mg [Eutrema salsugineum]